MKKPIFTGAGVALVTPFTEDGKINFPVLGELIEYQLANATDCIVICATTGESATLTDEEHVETIRYTVDRVAGRVPVVAGTGSNDTAHALRLSNEAEKMGVDGLLLVTPYYNKTSQEGLVRHFTYLADRVSVPLILYNVPGRTGCEIHPETYKELSKHGRINAAKEASGNISSIAKTAALCGDDLLIYSGDDDQTTPIMSLGGKGVISVLSNVAPRTAHDIAVKYLEGDVEASRELQLRYIELCNALFMDINPIPVKTALRMMGWDVGPLRLPLCDMPSQKQESLRSVLKKYGLI